MLFLLFLSFVLPPVLHPAPNQLVQSMADGVRVTFSRPSRPPNIPSPPPLIPTTKPTDKPSFIQGGSISQVRHQGVMAKVYWWLSGVLLLLHFYTTDIHTKAKSKPQWFPVEYFYFIFFLPLLVLSSCFFMITSPYCITCAYGWHDTHSYQCFHTVPLIHRWKKNS